MEDVPRPRVLATTPLFVVADLQRSLAFYCDKLGFRDPSVWGSPPCFAMIHRDHFDLMLSLAESLARVQPNGPSRVWDLYIRVDDLAAECAILKSEGVPLDRGPTRTEYQTLEAELVDPDGYRICLGQDVT